VSFLVVALKSPLPPGSKKAAASERKRKSRAKASPEKKMEEKEKRKKSMQCWKSRNITEPMSVRVSPCVQRAPGPMQAVALSVISEIHFNC